MKNPIPTFFFFYFKKRPKIRPQKKTKYLVFQVNV